MEIEQGTECMHVRRKGVGGLHKICPRCLSKFDDSGVGKNDVEYHSNDNPRKAIRQCSH